MSKLRVLFAPDYRTGVPYQAFLAEALTKLNIEVSFLSEYRRVLPLARGSSNRKPDVVHIHWPEKYFGQINDGFDRFRTMRYPLDLWLTALSAPVVWTAHNMVPHNRGGDSAIFRNMRYTARKSAAVFVHSAAARDELVAHLNVEKERIHVIPFGDHSIKMGRPRELRDARQKLGLPLKSKTCLIFGTVSPYKGTDELISFWKQSEVPHRLVVVGPVLSQAFAETLSKIAAGCPTIDLRLSRDWLPDEDLHIWLSAADCALFNYRAIFSSGAAALARSYGLPVVLPRRLTTVDLHEPDRFVFRFDTLAGDFRKQVERALATPRDYDHAKKWRDSTSWDRVAVTTAAVYQKIAGNR